MAAAAAGAGAAASKPDVKQKQQQQRTADSQRDERLMKISDCLTLIQKTPAYDAKHPHRLTGEWIRRAYALSFAVLNSAVATGFDAKVRDEQVSLAVERVVAAYAEADSEKLDRALQKVEVMRLILANNAADQPATAFAFPRIEFCQVQQSDGENDDDAFECLQWYFGSKFNTETPSTRKSSNGALLEIAQQRFCVEALSHSVPSQSAQTRATRPSDHIPRQTPKVPLKAGALIFQSLHTLPRITMDALRYDQFTLQNKKPESPQLPLAGQLAVDAHHALTLRVLAAVLPLVPRHKQLRSRLFDLSSAWATHCVILLYEQGLWSDALKVSFKSQLVQCYEDDPILWNEFMTYVAMRVEVDRKDSAPTDKEWSRQIEEFAAVSMDCAEQPEVERAILNNLVMNLEETKMKHDVVFTRGHFSWGLQLIHPYTMHSEVVARVVKRLKECSARNFQSAKYFDEIVRKYRHERALLIASLTLIARRKSERSITAFRVEYIRARAKPLPFE
jgi:hypothetical protein